MRSLTRALVLIVPLAGLACGGDATSGRGKTVVLASAADPENLLPPVGRSLPSKNVTDQLFERLADPGAGLNTVGDAGFEPRLAEKWTWSPDSLRITLSLDARARWHDGKPVRASDVRFAFSVYTDTLVGAPDGGPLRAAIDSISVGDSTTCTVWFKGRSPEQFYTLTTLLITLPEHLLGTARRDSLRSSAFARAPVGNGPYKFVIWEPKQRVEIAANQTFYRGRPKNDRVIWSIAPEASAAVQKVMTGEADFIEVLSPDAVAEAAKHPDVKVVWYGSFDYGFIRFNLAAPGGKGPNALFAHRAMRRALTMALDRGTMLRSVFDSLARPALGPFTRAQWSADSTLAQIGFDRAAAARTLDSLGWKVGKDSVRARGGKPLAFNLLVPSSSKVRGRYAVLIQEQLRLVGVKVNIESVDFAAFMAKSNARGFDAMLDGLRTGPSPNGVRDSWASAGIRGGKGPNYGSYANPVFDAHVDSALAAREQATARAHYRAAYQVIVDDAPGVWLFEPIAVAGANKRLDVGVLRSAGWWLGIPSWSVR